MVDDSTSVTKVTTAMMTLVVTSRNGRERVVKAKAGISIMEVLRNNGFEDVLALCGGCCSCATCHVYVDPAFARRLPPMNDDERDLLASSDHQTQSSRLSCQILLTDDMDGIRLTIAPGD